MANLDEQTSEFRGLVEASVTEGDLAQFPNPRAHELLVRWDMVETPPDILAICDEKNIPLFSTPLQAAEVIDFLRVYLSKKLAQHIMMHGVFMDVLGVGVLITGESGLGKSELGLELISRSHGLVADDAVEFSRIAPNMIEGRCPPLLPRVLSLRLSCKSCIWSAAARWKRTSSGCRCRRQPKMCWACRCARW